MFQVGDRVIYRNHKDTTPIWYGAQGVITKVLSENRYDVKITKPPKGAEQVTEDYNVREVRLMLDPVMEEFD